MSNARNLARLLPNASGQLPDAAMASGSVLQVVNAYASSSITNSSGTPVVLSGLSASITIREGSQILAIARSGSYGNTSGGWQSTGYIYIFRGGVQQAKSEHMGIIDASQQCYMHCITHHSGSLAAGTYTYDIRGGSTLGGAITFNRDGAQHGELTLLEIAA